MFAQLLQGLKAPKHAEYAHHLYVQTMQQSRLPVFFERYQVPDTLDGRFDILALHVSLLLLRLREEESDTPDDAAHDLIGSDLERSIIDTMMADMDQALREMSVGDSGIFRKVQKMGEALFGRLTAYEEALASNDQSQLENTLRRNVYGTLEDADIDANMLSLLAEYVMTAQCSLREYIISQPHKEVIEWPMPG